MVDSINTHEAVVTSIEEHRETLSPEESLQQLVEQLREISGEASTVAIHMQAALRATDSDIPHDANAPSVNERITSAKALALSLVARLESAEQRITLADESLSREAA